jgi:hypothetical protein
MADDTAASQRIAARIVGFTLLLLMASGLIGMFAFGGHHIANGDAAAITRNIQAHEEKFRAAVACEIVMLNCDVVLALALYALLKPVNSTLALLGSFWRIANAVLLGVHVAIGLARLDLFGDPRSMSLLTADQLNAVSLIFSGMQSHLSLMGLMFFCLGAGVHSWLLYKSRYIPRIISGLYLLASVEMLLCCFTFILFPNTRHVLDPAFLLPDFFAELSAALWLALKGAKLPLTSSEQSS